MELKPRYPWQTASELRADIRRAEKLIVRLNSIRTELRDKLRGRTPGVCADAIDTALFCIAQSNAEQIRLLEETIKSIRDELDLRARQAGW